MLEAGELARRFGADPMWFYIYNVGTSILSVLFSDPDRGVFHTVRTWLQGEIPARLYLPVRDVRDHDRPDRARRGRQMAWPCAAMPASSTQLLIIFGAVLIANAVVSYAYTKHEIISVAGAFYALAAYVAVRHAIEIGGLQDGSGGSEGLRLSGGGIRTGRSVSAARRTGLRLGVSKRGRASHAPDAGLSRAGRMGAAGSGANRRARVPVGCPGARTDRSTAPGGARSAHRQHQ